MVKWVLRRGLWNAIALVKFALARPRRIPLPPTTRRVITPKPMIEAIPEVPLYNVMVCARADIPVEERMRIST